MGRMLRWLHGWLGRLLHVQASGLPVIDPVLLEAAHVEVTRYLPQLTLSGEYKRDKAYKALIRQFPDVAHYHVSVAIELAYGRVRA